MVCTFGNYRVEAANLVDNRRQAVVVNKLGISENARCLTEKTFDGLPVGLYLVDKFVLRIQKAQTVIIGFAEKLHAAGVGQLFECGQYLRRKPFELFEQNACDAIGYFKFSLVFFE